MLVHAFGAVFDNPDLIAACVVGDGEAETGPLEGSWKGVSFLNPRARRRGAADPAPQRLQDQRTHRARARTRARIVRGLLERARIRGALRRGRRSACGARGVRRDARRAATSGFARSRRRRGAAGDVGSRHAGRRSCCARRRDGPARRSSTALPVEGTFRAHQVPLANVRDQPGHLAHARGVDAQLPTRGALRQRRPPCRRAGRARAARRQAHGRQPARQRRQAAPSPWSCRTSATTRCPSTPGVDRRRVDPPARRVDSRHLPRQSAATSASSARTRPTRNRLGAVFDVENRCFEEAIIPIDDHVSADGRVMEVLSEHLCEGWLEGYLLTGRHGLFATYEAFAMVSASMTVQHAKWLEAARDAAAGARRSPSLNILLTSTCWRNDHNGFSHQGPGLIDTVMAMSGDVVRIYLPPDANCLLSVADHCLRSRNYVNLIVIDKQPQLQWLTWTRPSSTARVGASIWDWAATTGDGEPDVVLGCAGDIPTLETLGAAALLREHVPELRVRVVNVVDLLALCPAPFHPHGLSAETFIELFTEDDRRGVGLPRLRAGVPPGRARPAERRTLPCARLQRAGHDDDAVRHGGAQRDEPLPPGDGGAPSIPAASRRRCRPASGTAKHSCAGTTSTSASTSRTCPRSATGGGRDEREQDATHRAGLIDARPRRERGLEQPQAERGRQQRPRRGRAADRR